MHRFLYLALAALAAWLVAAFIVRSRRSAPFEGTWREDDADGEALEPDPYVWGSLYERVPA